MKRGTIEHPKTAALADAVGVDLLMAVGLLEALWHFTAKYARQGNVGKFTNQAIADGVHWRNDGDELVRALVSCRFLDEDDIHRLMVHDWADHADGSVRKALKRAGEDFAEPTEPTGRIGNQPAATETDSSSGQSGGTERRRAHAHSAPIQAKPSQSHPRPSRPRSAHKIERQSSGADHRASGSDAHGRRGLFSRGDEPKWARTHGPPDR